MLNIHVPHVRTVVEQRAYKQSVLHAIGQWWRANERWRLAHERYAPVQEQKAAPCCGRLDNAAIQEFLGQVDQVVVETDAQAKSQALLGAR